MIGISMVLLVVKRPRQAQIRRKTYKNRKKHQDRGQDAKRQEKAQKVKKISISIAARWELLVRQEIRRNKSEENLSIAARCVLSQHDGVTWRPS
jgi:hypothetical protein